MPNPENLKPFKKGQSGNPDGRPPIVKELRTFIQERLSNFDPSKPEISHLEALTAKLIDMGLNGNLKALELLFMYGYGRPKEISLDTQDEHIVIRPQPISVKLISGIDPPESY